MGGLREKSPFVICENKRMIEKIGDL